jgi:hypothetical protein
MALFDVRQDGRHFLGQPHPMRLMVFGARPVMRVAFFPYHFARQTPPTVNNILVAHALPFTRALTQ